MKRKTFLVLILTLLLSGLIKCNDEGDSTPPEEDDLVLPSEGKFDTGYLSSLATELQGEFNGTLRLDLNGMTEEEKNNLQNDFLMKSWDAMSIILDQIKFGKKELNTELLHMNLYSDNFEIEDVNIEGNVMIVKYKALIESIVTSEELEKAGLTIDDVINNPKTIKIPADPRDIFQRVGESCATGFDPGTLEDMNYFYYFDPSKEGCNLELVDGNFSVSSLASPDSTTYPEYDLLVADGKITVAVFFGAAEHNEEVSDSDWGVNEWRQFISEMRNRGFKKVSDLEPGQRFSRSRSGIEEIIDVVSPYDLHALNNDQDGVFTKAVREHEIIIYDGHSFYGSLEVLRNKEAYPENTYQIFFMNSCWSYEYYTTQIFQNKITDDDTHGWKYADVVNNTEPAWFHNDAEETRILLTNIFAGAESGGMDSQGRFYTWANINAAMNQWAIDSWKRLSTESHEIYGVSGVKDNRYDPETNNNGGDGKRYDNNTQIDIPDRNADGVMSEIVVNDQITPKRVRVAVNITHTAVSDLVVSLVRGDTEVILHNREGGMEDDIIREYDVSDQNFINVSGQGSWFLKVVDKVRADTGKINSWSLILLP